MLILQAIDFPGKKYLTLRVTLKFEPEILRQNQPPGKYKTGIFLRYFGFGRTFTMSCCDK